MAKLRDSKRLNLLTRIILILLVGFSSFLVIYLSPYWLLGIWLGVLLVIQVLELVRYHERSQKALKEFLTLIKQGEFSSNTTVDEVNKEFQSAYELLMDKFRDLRIEKESNYHYLKRIIEHVDTALLCLKDNQKVQLINRASMDLLQVTEIRDLGALEKVNGELAIAVRKIKSGHREMIRFIRHGRIMKLSIRATEFSLDGQQLKIVSLQDIKSELEEQELDAWQKLVRVLTHEIMNSAIPITNMVAMAREILLDEQGKTKEIPGLSEEETKDLMLSLYTAESRSQGLSNFVQSTRSLSRIPEPSFVEVRVKDLFNRLSKIFKADLKEKGIFLKIIVEPETMSLNADVDLMEQVLINLLKNAADAVSNRKDPSIELVACKSREGGLVIRVFDNGQGISPDSLDQIFVPFYSTKKEGSGIGLSLSLQIMKLHRGRIDVQSEEGKGSCFSLEF